MYVKLNVCKYSILKFQLKAQLLKTSPIHLIYLEDALNDIQKQPMETEALMIKLFCLPQPYNLPGLSSVRLTLIRHVIVYDSFASGETCLQIFLQGDWLGFWFFGLSFLVFQLGFCWVFVVFVCFSFLGLGFWGFFFFIHFFLFG